MMTTAKISSKETKRNLPDGWRWVRVGEVCKLVGDSVNPKEFPDETFAHYSIPAFDVGQKPAIELGATILSNKVLFPDGTVLFSKLNPRITRAWNVTDDQMRRRICSTEFLPLLPNSSELAPDYLTFVLQEPQLIKGLRARVQAATKSRERLRPEMVLSAEIPLPPLADQKRIAAILNEQMAAVEHARALAAAQLEAAKALPAAYLRAVFNSPETQSWPRKPLGEFVASYRNGFGRRPSGIEDGPIVLRLADVSSGFIDLSSPRHVSMSDEEIETYRLRKDEVLFLRVNGSRDLIGRCIVVDVDSKDLVFNDHLIRVQLREGLEPYYLRAACDLYETRAFLVEQASTSAGQLTINQEILASLHIPIPSLSEQRRIVADLGEQMTSVERTRQALETQLAVINALPGTLLRRAFNGEL